MLAAGSIDRLGAPEFRRHHLVNMEMKVVADPDSRLGRKRRITPLVQAARKAGLVELELHEPLWQLPVGLFHRPVAEHSKTVMAFNALCTEWNGDVC